MSSELIISEEGRMTLVVEQTPAPEIIIDSSPTTELVLEETQTILVLSNLPGSKGDRGNDGSDGADGTDGLSAYQLAVANGFVGTEAEWLSSLHGVDGEDGLNGSNGDSAYEIAVNNGFVGTESEWLESMSEPGTTALAEIAAHISGADPHPQYETAVETAAKYSPIAIKPLEAVPMTIFGDSYAAMDITGYHGPAYRTARRSRMQEPVNKAVSHTTYAQNFTAIKAGWVPGTSGLVWFSGTGINDLVAYYPASNGPSTARISARACFALLSAADLTPISEGSSGPIVYGPGWTNGVSDGVANRYVDLAYTGFDCYVLLSCVTGTGATVEFRNSSDAVVASFSTGGYAGAITGAVKMPTLSSGSHTLRMVVTSGVATLVGLCPVLLLTAPPILWDKPGPIVFGGDAEGTVGLRAYTAEVEDEVLDNFPNVIIADSDVSGWDKNTMLTADQTHRNDRGNYFTAAVADTVLRSTLTDFTEGLNTATYYTAGPTYTRPNAAYTKTGATVPSAPSAFVATAGNQVSFTWARPSDGGSTLTGYVIEFVPTAGGTWTTLATITDRTATNAVVTTGLTASTSYDFRIKATNSVGSSSVSTTSTAVAGASPVVYSSDSFNRADSLSMGSSEVGNFAWTAKNSAAFNIISNAAQFISGAGTYGSLVVNDGFSDGTFTCTAVRNTTGGIIVAADSTANTGYILFNSSGTYMLMKRTAVGAYTTLGTATGVTATLGDQLKIIKSGSSLKAYINGTLRITATDSTYNGTYHGLFGITAGDRWDNWSHNNALV